VTAIPPPQAGAAAPILPRTPTPDGEEEAPFIGNKFNPPYQFEIPDAVSNILINVCLVDLTKRYLPA
jgi:hypothetical protein